jgi:hypothetical protein
MYEEGARTSIDALPEFYLEFQSFISYCIIVHAVLHNMIVAMRVASWTLLAI